MDRSQYFYRTVIISKQGDKVSLVDIFDPKKEALDFEPWLGIIVSLADGKHTIQELVDYLVSHYQGTPPSNLADTLESAINRLIETEMIKLSEGAIELPYYLAVPANVMDIEKAKRLMAEDGYPADDTPTLN
ncbi:MAG TPA: hypothetical protein QF499_05585 [Gammaproteobacteria bacterium]|nr:hypothetical protein [Chromatiales bacterium]MCP4924595.1 hypothetical protein [Gammaproteobacteria bacterium]MDP7659886.1 hypothetical protein [Gammaproteobacteria bacterium]HJP38588.1 hypothetical protein [Gammaproteobacteria bacterium]